MRKLSAWRTSFSAASAASVSSSRMRACWRAAARARRPRRAAARRRARRAARRAAAGARPVAPPSSALRADHVDQARQRGGLLVEQGQVAGAAQRSRCSSARPRGSAASGCAAARGRFQQRRQHVVEALARALGQVAHGRRAREICIAARGAPRPRRSRRRPARSHRRPRAARASSAPARRARPAVVATSASRRSLGDHCALRVESRQQCGGQSASPSASARCAGAAADLRAGRGSAASREHLQAVLEPAQEAVGVGQPRRRRRRQVAGAAPAPQAPAAARARAGPARGRRGSAAGPAPGIRSRGCRRGRA